MRSWKPIALSLLLFPLSTLSLSAAACDPNKLDLSQTEAESILPTVIYYETSSKNGAGYGKITPDFDGQGLSAGQAQWNIGKGSLQGLVRDIIAQDVANAEEILGPFYVSVVDGFRYRPDNQEQLAWIREYQDISGTGGNRQASWKKGEGEDLARRLSLLMESPAGRAAQDAKMLAKAEMALDCALAWWFPKTPTMREVAVFIDALTFHGDQPGAYWQRVASREKVEKFIANAGGDKPAFNAVISYLENDLPWQQRASSSARESAVLWKTMYADGLVDGDSVRMLVFGYLIADAINKRTARQFKYLTITRKGTLALNKGYVYGTPPAKPLSFNGL